MPRLPLPISEEFDDVDDYIDSLLSFVTSSDLLNTLCGGVHILDFFTSDPDLYESLLPQPWRQFFENYEIDEILQFLLRKDPNAAWDVLGKQAEHSQPSKDLCQYVQTIRRLSLVRDFPKSVGRAPDTKPDFMTPQVAMGMNVKKTHEVGYFSEYIDTLATNVSKQGQRVTHLVDFGSGQNYLGRCLASAPFKRDIIAVENKSSNIEVAKVLDIKANLAQREKVVRDKQRWKRKNAKAGSGNGHSPASDSSDDEADFRPEKKLEALHLSKNGAGLIRYVEHKLQNGELSKIVEEESSPREIEGLKMNQESPRCMVMSLHSCGNLVHHGLRSLFLNDFVVAVALIGCCYNLVTERLSRATYKLPNMPLPRGLTDEELSHDPHGFPMSERLANYSYKGKTGVTFNITARTMAVQAPDNWTEQECSSFFTRHFYRALLQRIFLDRGIIGRPDPEQTNYGGRSPAGGSHTEPIIIGSLRKGCYTSFVAYVHGAMAKIEKDPKRGERFRRGMEGLSDENILEYERTFLPRKKHLSVVWSLMAFSAILIEAVIVVDRWQFLREHQDTIADCWVESAFDYRQSPRNLVVVGIKKQG